MNYVYYVLYRFYLNLHKEERSAISSTNTVVTLGVMAIIMNFLFISEGLIFDQKSEKLVGGETLFIILLLIASAVYITIRSHYKGTIHFLRKQFPKYRPTKLVPTILIITFGSLVLMSPVIGSWVSNWFN